MIRIKLEKWENSVLLQVLEMNEELRGKGCIYTNNQMELLSKAHPELSPVGLFIRGVDKDTDHQICIKHFSNNKSRDEYYERISTLISDYNNRDIDEDGIYREDTIRILVG